MTSVLLILPSSLTTLPVLLNNQAIIEELVTEKNFLALVGALERALFSLSSALTLILSSDDPDVLPGQLRHTEFIQKTAAFRQVVPFPEEPTTAMVHANFRLQYLKDVAIAKVMDENVNSTLSSLIFVNNVKIVTTLISYERWLNSLYFLLSFSSSSLPHPF